MSLASARAKRDEARTLVAEGKDPSEARKDAKAQVKLEALTISAIFICPSLPIALLRKVSQPLSKITRIAARSEPLLLI
ncbi:hypothetical protein Q9292_06365 [Methylophilus sp. VKM B-3414]|nr:integrase arm-type DNA-binding domain-containing protein [Methylophilus sp. VKM B-3414]MDT7849228.1 hypothetical protein [Methylophilus sp. VKM B-3414]